MSRRVKEEEKIEKTIRNLLKLPENRRCMNCNSLGPQYVCTTFLTFVCTSCSGVHREFTHRVKSVSMAKFTAEEVTALQAAGNERARQIYLKIWDPQRHSYPENSNLQRLREFIKHVYVDRKYSGGNGVSELPRLRLTDKDSSQEKRKVPSYSGGLQSLQVDMPRSSSKKEYSSPVYYYDERSSPRYSRENSRSGGYRRSLTLIEVVDNRIKDDRIGIRKLSNEDSKSTIHLSRSQENSEKSSPAVICDNKVTTDKNEPTRRVEEDASRKDKGVDASGSDKNEVHFDPVETKRDNVASLIDLSISSSPSDTTAASQSQSKPSSNNDNWNAFESSSTITGSTASSANTLEALLFALSVPSTGADNNPTGGPGNAHAPATVSGSTLLTPNFTVGQTTPPVSTDASVAGSTQIVPLQASSTSPPPLTTNKGGDIALKVTNRQQIPSSQQKQTLDSPAAETGLISQRMAPAIVPNFEWTSSSELTAQEHSSVSAEKIDADSKPAQGTTKGVGSQATSSESSSSGRKELPLDLFTVNFPQAPISHPGWQTATQRVMGQNLQYFPTSMTAKPTNPFDLDDEKSRIYSQSTPTNMSAVSGLTRSQSYEPPEAQYLGKYAGQQVHGSIPSLRPQGEVDNYGGSSYASRLGSLNTSQQQARNRYPAPNTNPIARNNPFG